jgi:DNA-binding NtrC family response regulator
MSEKSHILLVDDEPLMLAALQRVLRHPDYVVHISTSPVKALDILREEPIKVIISDQRMPVMLGHELLMHAKTIRPRAVRMLLTGYSDLEAVMKAVNAGQIFRYISKPCDNQRLRELVALALETYHRVETIYQETQRTTPLVSKSDTPALNLRSLLPRIVVFDENTASLNAFVKTFGNAYDVVAAGSVEELFREIALAKELVRPIDALVADIQIKEGDGVDVLSAIHLEYPELVQLIYTHIQDFTSITRAINEALVFKFLPKSMAYADVETELQRAVLQTQSQKQYPPDTNSVEKTIALDNQRFNAVTLFRKRLRSASASIAQKR